VTTDPASSLLTEREAAAVAHVPVETLRTWVKRRKLRPVQTPDGRRFVELDVLDVERALAAGDGRRDARLIAESIALLPDLEAARHRAAAHPESQAA
jgi:hypothetical protein